jgi:hypothetical protein
MSRTRTAPWTKRHHFAAVAFPFVDSTRGDQDGRSIPWFGNARHRDGGGLGMAHHRRLI